MSYFLWVEDFQTTSGRTEVASTIKNVFGEVLDQDALPPTMAEEVAHFFQQQQCGVFVERTFFDALQFLYTPEKLLKADYIVLDIDLPLASYPNTNHPVYTNYSEILQRYPSEAEFKKVAGYQLYVELVMNLGFPKEHILFCSNHEQYLASIKTAFQEAKISLPKPVPSKHESDRDIIRQWIREHRNNRYVTLRRGIIEGCQLLLDQLSQNSNAIHFHHYFQKGRQTAEELRDDLRNYLETLKTFLPLREPESSANKPMLFKLFARTLAHEWETSANPSQYQGPNSTFYQALGWIMKSTRNWLSHSQILDGLQEEEVAFLFLAAMRAMFNLGNQPETYEKILFRLFQATATTELQQHIKDNLVDSYVMVKEHLLNAVVKVEDAIPFNKMLDNMQSKNVSLPGNYSYLTGLFQMFWHGLSPASLHKITPKPPVTKTVKHTVTFEMNCTFGNQDFGASQPNDFLFQFARHIYQRSFSCVPCTT